jgi:hypothetical protein
MQSTGALYYDAHKTRYACVRRDEERVIYDYFEEKEDWKLLPKDIIAHCSLECDALFTRKPAFTVRAGR